MDVALVRFIAALRQAGLPVSNDETLVAAQSIKLLGYGDRGQLKSALALTLAKTTEHKERFSDCFERFYGQHGDMQHGQATEPPAGTATDETPTLTPQLDQLLSASNEQMQMRIQEAGRQAGVESIRLFTQRGVYQRRILQQLDWPALQDAILATGRGSSTGSALQDFAARLQGLTRDYVEQQYLLYGAPRSGELRDRMLMQTRINQLDPSQIAHCRKLVKRIVRRLLKHFKRRKRYYRRGLLDLHTTLRHNMPTEGALFKLYWRRKHRDRPRVFVLCDVSGSVRQYAELMLLFVYSLQDILPKTRCYAFSSRVEDVSALLKQGKDIDAAISATLKRIGGGATDYASALQSFASEAGPLMTRNSVIIVLGDARNNRSDPALETFRHCTSRAGKTYWLNPESRFLWNTGDSVIAAYQRYCDGLFETGTLAQLESFCEYLLRKSL